jgi:Domain of unknown function (DUF5666)
MNVPTSRRLGRILPLLLAAGSVALAVLTAVTSSAGIQGSGHYSLLAVGAVTDTGSSDSIAVSGIPYSIAGAAFRVNGHAGTRAAIRAGDIVSLVANPSSDGAGYAAAEVTFNGDVQGTVSAIDSQSARFFVLGQTVRVDSNTVFSSGIKPSSLAGLHVGDAVEVSAFANSTGDLIASRVQGRGHREAARVVGGVRSLDPVQHTFYINALKVDFSRAEVIGELTENTPVRVQGTRFETDGALVANIVRAQAPTLGDPGAAGRIQGLITSYSSSSYFEVNGQPVVVSAGTQLKLTEPLGLDVAVLVSGSFDTHGVLVADTVQ